jgi:hypothetical protein
MADDSDVTRGPAAHLEQLLKCFDNRQREEQAAVPIWLVKATWTEDEAEASERWEVNAATAHDALKAVEPHLCFQPHHVEARLCAPEAAVADLSPGETRRLAQ